MNRSATEFVPGRFAAERKRCAVAVLVVPVLLLAPVPPSAAGEAAFPLNELHLQPLTVWHKQGRQLTGIPIDVTEGAIVLTTQEGRVEYTVHAADIAQVQLPGDPYLDLARDLIGEGRRPEALTVLEALFNHRLPYLPYLQEKDIACFVDLAEGRLWEGRTLEAVAIAEHLLERLSGAVRQPLERALLRAYYRLEWDDAVRQRAVEWIHGEGRFSESALGWWVLGATALRNRDYEGALDAALHPIVFSSQLPVADLEICYAVAIHAALALDDATHARLLYREMRDDRRLRWPASTEPESGLIPDPARMPSPGHLLE